jgi:cation:H+ antiporter
MLGLVTVVDQQLSAIEGYLLLAAYTGFIIYITHHVNHTELHKHAKINVQKLWKLLVRAIVGVLGLLIFSTQIVDAAILLAQKLHISSSVIGMLVIALGTNIPELTMAIRSRNLEENKLAAGNFLGSACVNIGILGLLGIMNDAATIKNAEQFFPLLVLLTITIVLFGILAWTDSKLTRREGVVLLSLYLALLVAEGLNIYSAGL